MTIVKDVAQLVNGRINQADRLTIDASFAPLENGQPLLGSPLMLNAQTCVQQENGQIRQALRWRVSVQSVLQDATPRQELDRFRSPCAKRVTQDAKKNYGRASQGT